MNNSDVTYNTNQLKNILKIAKELIVSTTYFAALASFWSFNFSHSEFVLKYLQ